MLQHLYNWMMRAYFLAIKSFGFFNEKAKKRAENNLNYQTVLHKRKPNAPLAWFHCASLGEFEQGRPVIESFSTQYPNWQILLTFFSPSGYDVRKNYAAADIVCYLPIDKPKDARAFVQAFQPNLAVFVKYEFWRNFLINCKEKNIPLLSISTIFRPSQLFFSPFGGFQRQVLHTIDHFFVQNEESAQLLDKIEIKNYSIAGDTRFDRVADTLKNIKAIPLAQKFVADKLCMVCGSVWPEDMEVLLPFMAQNPELKFIVAPHEIQDSEMSKWENRMENGSLRFSNAEKHPDLLQAQCLIIDNVGMLSSLYQYGSFAFIGGAFGAGLHNILEAATFGMPLFFGHKKYHKFQEAHDLIAKQVAFPVANYSEFQDAYNRIDFTKRQQISTDSRSYIEEKTGATEMIMHWIENHIPVDQ
ncbi:3-deoxy-D-manno-octulosonic acid transferase [Marinilongibacter aquaticus]|uniref:3-deoxy-D-manno-octulosonic acid transferase n=1 Tax=Marinilongibacter aquaticus TaxID=2975157 RepID=UPI0021BD82FA|nr:glycosyltransferase N-terminal domain-containing protein [Marinilongibacter aquaticus]UBM60682.1 3-deoxy-D-manno-octulosonic acid transferase [Marinilongibacter aquaticus]